MAEIYAAAEQLGEFLMPCKEQVIVRGRALKFGKALLDPYEGPVHVLDRGPKDLFNEGHARPAVAEGEEDALPVGSGEDEVRFRIAHSVSRIDILRPLVNEGARS